MKRKSILVTILTILMTICLTACSFDINTGNSGNTKDYNIEQLEDMDIDNAEETADILDEIDFGKIKSHTITNINGHGKATIKDGDNKYQLIIEDDNVISINDADGMEIYNFSEADKTDKKEKDAKNRDIEDTEKKDDTDENVDVDNDDTREVGAGINKDNDSSTEGSYTDNDTYGVSGASSDGSIYGTQIDKNTIEYRYVTATLLPDGNVSVTPNGRLKSERFTNGPSVEEVVDELEDIVDASDWGRDNYSINKKLLYNLTEAILLDNEGSEADDNKILETIIVMSSCAYMDDEVIDADRNKFESATIDMNTKEYKIKYGANELVFISDSNTLYLNGSEVTWLQTYIDCIKDEIMSRM